jgi:hypothetical protein
MRLAHQQLQVNIGLGLEIQLTVMPMKAIRRI